MRSLFFLCVICLITGCSHNDWLHSRLGNWCQNGFKVGPQYRKPCAEVSPDWIDTYDARVQGDLPRYNYWWQVFNDPVLDDLIGQTYASNLDLRAAGMRILQARAVRGIAAGDLFPQLQQLDADYVHTLQSRTVLGGSSIPAGKRGFDSWSTGFSQAWELDIWGKFRRQIESSDAALDASIHEYDDILVLLIAETAATYVEYRTLQERLRLTAANIGIQEGSLKIAQDRFNHELVSKLDVTQARTILEQTLAAQPRLEVFRRNAMLRLCVLTGRPPQELTAELGDAAIPIAPEDVAVGIPADLVRRRPDVRRAERLVAVQSAQIGVAVSELFPHFSITGFLGWESENLTTLLRTESASGFIGAPSVQWNLLNYGRLLNNIRLEDARYEQLVYAYRQRVLLAGEEAEQAINAFLRAQEETAALTLAVEANQESVELADVQYNGGFVDFNRVFTLQGQLVTTQDQLAVAQGGIALSLIAIYRSLGGGWQIRFGEQSFVETVSSAELTPPLFEDTTPSDQEAALPFPMEDNASESPLETALSPLTSTPNTIGELIAEPAVGDSVD